MIINQDEVLHQNHLYKNRHESLTVPTGRHL